MTFEELGLAEPIERLAVAILRDPQRIRIAPVKATTELIEESVFFVPRQQKPRFLASFLGMRAVTRALVFTRTKHGADRVARHLNRAGIRADAIHGNGRGEGPDGRQVARASGRGAGAPSLSGRPGKKQRRACAAPRARSQRFGASI